MAADDRGPFRVANESDAEAVTDTIFSAFDADPLWAGVFERSPGGAGTDRTDVYRAWWRLFVDGALPHRWVWVTANCEAVAVWLPPGTSELGPGEEEQAEALVSSLPEPQRSDLRSVLDLFAAARPTEPHFYLSLLGTHGDHRGAGIGMALLAHTLAEVDATGQPAYLESTNPANLARYRSVGFAPRGTFTVAGSGPEVTTMWRSSAEPI